MPRTVVALLAALLALPAAGQSPAPRPAAQHLPTTDAEKITSAAEQLQAMRAGVGTLTGQLESARSSRDVVRQNCVNEKLAQLKALLKAAEQASTALGEAVARKDPSSESEYARVRVARAKGDALVAEAGRCQASQVTVTEGATSVVASEPPGPADEDGRLRGASAPPPPPPAAPARPPPASPYR